jgi:transposase
MRAMKSKHFRPYEPEQSLLMPPNLGDWLPEDHLVFFVRDVVDQLDLGPILADYKVGKGGFPPYDPRMMVRLLLYAYCKGVASSRKIERATHESVPFRVIAANQHPDHDTVSEFRKRHLAALSDLFVQVLELCREAGLAKLGKASLDGTKVRANASKHKAMSYGRVKKKRAELEAGAKAEADARRAEIAEKEEERREKEERTGRGTPGRKPKPPSDEPAEKAQRNFTDPDSRIMKDGARYGPNLRGSEPDLRATKSFERCYNAEAAVDAESQVIAAADVTQDANDKQQVKPMVEQVKSNAGDTPEKLSADSDFYSEANVEYPEAEGVDAYVATEKVKHGARPPPPRGPIPKDATTKDRMRRKLRTKKGRETYSRRKPSVEPAFGQIQDARGFRRFLLSGLEAVRAEWRLIALTHNLLKLFRSGGPARAG